MTAHELARELLAGPDLPVIGGEFRRTDMIAVVVVEDGAVILDGEQ